MKKEFDKKNRTNKSQEIKNNNYKDKKINKINYRNEKNNMNNYQVRKKRKLNIFTKVIIFILAMILIVAIVAVTTFYIYLNNKLSKINYIDLKRQDIYIDSNIDNNLSNYRNIALLGIDARSDTFEEGNRSDCIMILSINKTSGNVKICSVYRDTYVDITDHGLDKINHAYSYGGPQLALNTLNKNLDLNISEFVAINFDTVKSVVDSVGGISMFITSDEVKYINNYIDGLNTQFGTNSTHITEYGTYTLDGVQALAYSRIRYTDGGDYKRTARMRDVLLKVFDKAKQMNLSKLNTVVNETLDQVSTNISKNEIISTLTKINSYHVTDDFGWPYKTKGITKNHWYGVPVDLKTNVSLLHQELFEQENYTVSETVQNISDEIIEDTGYTK